LKVREHTRLNGTGNLVSETRGLVTSLLEGRLLGIRLDLVGDLVGGIFAESVRHFDGCVV
jgi:hypothetical protein